MTATDQVAASKSTPETVVGMIRVGYATAIRCYLSLLVVTAVFSVPFLLCAELIVYWALSGNTVRIHGVRHLVEGRLGTPVFGAVVAGCLGFAGLVVALGACTPGLVGSLYGRRIGPLSAIQITWRRLPSLFGLALLGLLILGFGIGTASILAWRRPCHGCRRFSSPYLPRLR